MSERRSGRARSKVDYSKFADDDDDDDFAEMTPPVSKKPKPKESKPIEKEKTTKDRKKRVKKQAFSSDEEEDEFVVKPKKKKKDERVSLDDKLFERDLQMALEISKSSQGDTTQDSLTEVTIENSVVKKASSPNKSSPAAKKECKTKSKDVEKENIQEDFDKIEILEENIQEEECNDGRRKRRAATKAAKKFFAEEDEEDDIVPTPKNDGDFTLDVKEHISDEEDEDDDDDDDLDLDDDDSDFGSPKKRGGRGRGRGKKNTSGISPPRPKPVPRMTATVYPVNKARGKPAAKAVVRAVNSLPGLDALIAKNASNSGGPLNIRKPNWASDKLSGISLKSPGGGIRLGLSRNMKVKPLHSSVKVPH